MLDRDVRAHIRRKFSKSDRHRIMEKILATNLTPKIESASEITHFGTPPLLCICRIKVIDENGNFEFFTDALAKFTQMC